MNQKLKEAHPILLVLILFVIGAFAFSLLSGIIAALISFFQPDLVIENLHLLSKEFPVAYMFYYFVPFQLGFLFIPAAYYFYFLRDHCSRISFNWKNYLWASLLFISVFFLLPFFNEINYYIAKLLGVYENLAEVSRLNEERIIELVGLQSSNHAFWVGILIISVVTAISEELLFRGFLMNLIAKHTKSVGLSIIGSALFFALLHFNYLQLIPLIVFGIALGAMYQVTGSLLPSILFHAANNAINLYWVRTDIEVSWMNEIQWEITIPSIILLMGLIYLKRKKLF